MNIKKYYVIQNEKGAFFKIDNNNGGYALFIDDFEFCEKFNSEEFAKDFLKGNYATKMFRDKFKNCIVKTVIMTLE